MILHDITWYYMQKLYTYNLTIKTSIYSKPAGHDQNKTSRVDALFQSPYGFLKAILGAMDGLSTSSKNWLTDTRKKCQKNIIQYHPASSNIIQHHPTSQQTPAVLHQRLFVAQWLLLHCFVLNEFTCVQVDRHHLARPQPPFGFEHVLRIRRTSRRFCGSERDGFLAGSDANVRLWGNGS